MFTVPCRTTYAMQTTRAAVALGQPTRARRYSGQKGADENLTTHVRPVRRGAIPGILEHSLDAIAIVEPDGTVSYVSPSIVRVLGYTPEEFVELKAFEAVHPDDRDAAIRRFTDIVRQPGGSQTVLNRVRHKDGSWRWIETVSTNQLENPSVRAVVSNFRDITDRRRIEEALRDREEHFRLIVESAIDFAIFTLSLDGRIMSWNIGAERILGYTEEEILGRHVSVIFTPEDNATGRAEFEMRGAAHEGHDNDDRWHVKKGGIRFWANGMMMPLKDEAGETQGYLKILRDRTEQQLAREALRDADRRKDEFLAMLAHELRNPLAAITNAVQLSLRSDRESRTSMEQGRHRPPGEAPGPVHRRSARRLSHHPREDSTPQGTNRPRPGHRPGRGDREAAHRREAART